MVLGLSPSWYINANSDRSLYFQKTMRKFLILLSSVFLVLALNGCGASAPALKPFKMDIQQGNVVTSKMLLQLKPGMTKSQVRFIMGTPLVVDSFHKDRWDYFYQLRQAGKVVEQRRVILDFEKDLLSKVRGDVVPAGTAGAASGDESIAKTIVMPAKKAEEKSWTEKLKFWKSDEKTPQQKPVAAKPIEKLEVAKPPVAENERPGAEPAVEEAASVLTVPMSIDTPEVVAAPSESLPAAPTVAEPVVIAPPNIEPPKPIEAAKAVVLAPAPNKSVQPAPISPNKQDEKIIFRMDRTLKTELLEQETASTPVLEPSATPKVKKPELPLPPETEPGFFDRMLEKIGF